MKNLYQPWLFLLWRFLARNKHNCCLCMTAWVQLRRSMQTYEGPWKSCCCRVLSTCSIFLFYYLKELFCFTWHFELMYHTTMIMQDSQSLLNTSFFKSVMFSLTTVASTYNSRLAWKAEKHILIKALFVGNGLNVQ